MKGPKETSGREIALMLVVLAATLFFIWAVGEAPPGVEEAAIELARRGGT